MVVTKPTLPFMETMITQVCNMACQGCSNYSDVEHRGYVTWRQGSAWIESWQQRVEIQDFGIMGGEPLINPECREWLIGVREKLPHARIRFTTNGTLLSRNLDIVELMHQLGNFSFKITVHLHDAGLEDTIQQIIGSYDWQSVHEHGIDRMKTSNEFRFHVRRPQRFLRTYQGTGYHDMAPWHSVPQKAFDICIQQTCPLLHQGNLYKCSTAGLLRDMLNRFQPPNRQQWQPYVPEPLRSDCTDQELDQFLANFGRPHSICGQCPEQHHTGMILHDHTTVRSK